MTKAKWPLFSITCPAFVASLRISPGTSQDPSSGLARQPIVQRTWLHNTSGTGWTYDLYETENDAKAYGVAVLVCMVPMVSPAQETEKPEICAGYLFTSTDRGWHGNGRNTGARMVHHEMVGYNWRLDWMLLRFNCIADTNNVRPNTGRFESFAIAEEKVGPQAASLISRNLMAKETGSTATAWVRICRPAQALVRTVARSENHL